MQVSIVDVQVQNPRLSSDNALVYDQVRLCVQVTRRHFPAFWKTSTMTRWYRRGFDEGVHRDAMTGIMVCNFELIRALEEADTEALHEIYEGMTGFLQSQAAKQGSMIGEST